MDAPQRVHNVIQGQILRRSARREVALFLRGETLWVADFVDGHGEIIDAVTWIRFNCGASNAQVRRMALESTLPLSDDLVARILALDEPEEQQRGVARNESE